VGLNAQATACSICSIIADDREIEVEVVQINTRPELRYTVIFRTVNAQCKEERGGMVALTTRQVGRMLMIRTIITMKSEYSLIIYLTIPQHY
jgi:hypothetical protein